jgi:predicted DNA binding CopG/RHH family protein
MSKLKLDQDELALLASYEAEEWKSARNAQEQKQEYRSYARSTFRKDRRVNIRISSKDLVARSVPSVRWIPYQTLISSVTA